MKEYDCYLFDSDGTLTDTTELIYQSYVHAATVLDKPLPNRQEVFATIGMPLRPQMDIFLGPLTDTQYEEYQAVYMEYQFDHFKEHLTLFPGIKELLLKLKALRKPLAVVTSRRLQSLKPFLESLQIFDLFDVVVTPECTTLHKPSAEPVEYALEQLGFTKDQAVFIGDATYDIESGTAAGVDTVFVQWSTLDVTTMNGQPTVIVESADDILW